MNINIMKLTIALAAASAVALSTGCSSDATEASGQATARPTAQATPPSETPGQGPARGGQGGRMPGTFGIIADVQGSTMQVQGSDGQTAVTWTDETSFTRQVAGTAADIAVGSCVLGMGEEGDDGSVTASRLTVTEPVDGECQAFGDMGQGGPGGDRPDGGQRPEGAPTDLPSDLPTDMPTDRPSGMPEGGPGGGGGMPGAFVAGTVSAVDGDTLTVTTAGEDSATQTVTLGADAAIVTTAEASSADVAVGLCATARGETDDTGAVTAGTVQLSEAVDGECGMGGGPR